MVEGHNIGDLTHEGSEVVHLGDTFLGVDRKVRKPRDKMVIGGYDTKRVFQAYVWSSLMIVAEATIQIIQESTDIISDVAAVFIEGRVALTHVVDFYRRWSCKKGGGIIETWNIDI